MDFEAAVPIETITGVRVASVRRLTGGCIGDVFAVELADGVVQHRYKNAVQVYARYGGFDPGFGHIEHLAIPAADSPRQKQIAVGERRFGDAHFAVPNDIGAGRIALPIAQIRSVEVDLQWKMIICSSIAHDGGMLHCRGSVEWTI